MRSYNHRVAETKVDLGGIAGAVAARARAMTPDFDPGGFLEGLSGQLQGLIPHDRVTVLYLDEGGRTVSVFAEHAPDDAPRHDSRYTLSPARGRGPARPRFRHHGHLLRRIRERCAMVARRRRLDGARAIRPVRGLLVRHSPAVP